MSDIMKLLGKQWKECENTEPFFNKYNEAKSVYLEHMDEYNSNH